MAPDHCGAAISAHNLAAGLSNFGGPLIATIAMPLIGFEGVCWFYAGLYLLGALLTFFIKVDQPGVTSPLISQIKSELTIDQGTVS